TGIVWPDDVKPRTSLTVLCPRGGASHDIGVLLPDLERDNVDWPDEDLPARSQPETDTEPEPEQVDEPVPVDDHPTALPGTGTLALPAAEPTWPGNDDLSPGETTEV